MQEQLDQILAAGIERGAAPGAVAVVVNRDGEVALSAAGERAAGSGLAMTTDTVGAIFSMTKAVTGAAAMQLVEQGRLDLDAPAGEICPQLGEVTVLDGFDSDRQPLTRPPASPVTLRNLLTHTSGFVYTIWNANAAMWHDVTGVPDVLSLEKASLTEPLAFDPGTKWEYGIGIDWAGQMVEAVSGQTLGEYFAEHLTGPLGMNDTAFAHTPSMLERASAIHGRGPDGSLAPIDIPPPENPEFEMGGGGLHGTEFFPGEPKTWGLTFQINEQAAATGRPAGTLMWAGLANSFFWIDRENGLGGAYLSQILPFGDQQSLDLFYEVEAAAYAAL